MNIKKEILEDIGILTRYNSRKYLLNPTVQKKIINVVKEVIDTVDIDPRVVINANYYAMNSECCAEHGIWSPPITEDEFCTEYFIKEYRYEVLYGLSLYLSSMVDHDMYLICPIREDEGWYMDDRDIIDLPDDERLEAIMKDSRLCSFTRFLYNSGESEYLDSRIVCLGQNDFVYFKYAKFKTEISYRKGNAVFEIDGKDQKNKIDHITSKSTIKHFRKQHNGSIPYISYWIRGYDISVEIKRLKEEYGLIRVSECRYDPTNFIFMREADLKINKGE